MTPAWWFHALSDESETWTGPFVTREAAVADGRAEYAAYLGDYSDDPDVGNFFIAIGVPVDPAQWLPNVANIIENIKDECADDDSGVDPDQHLVFAEGAKKALEELLEVWCDKYVQCKYCTVGGDVFGAPERIQVKP